MRAVADVLAPPPRGPDLRLAPGALAAWGAAWWAVGQRPAAAVAAGLGGVLLALLAGALARRRRWAGTLGAAAACAALVLLSCAGQVWVRGQGLLPELAAQGATARVVGSVVGDPRTVRPDPGLGGRPQPERVVVRVSVTAVEGRGRAGPARAQVLVLGPRAGWASLTAGARVAATGRLVAAEPGDDVLALLVASAPPRVVSPPPGWQRAAESLRAGLRASAEPLPDDAGGLLPGLVVGDTSGLPPDLEEDMRRVGLSHLTAVSGANVAIVCGTVLVVAAAVGAGRRLRLALAAVALAGFVVLARPEPSVLRAAVMGGIGLVGLAAARRGRGLPLLCCAVVALTAVDPWLSRSFGFALSVLATGALLLLARPVADALARWLPTPAALAVAVPTAAQAVSAPVVVLLSPEVPLLAVPANLAVAPAVAPATVLGVVATVLAPVWMPAAEVAAWLGGLATGWIAGVARVSAGVPASTVPWVPGIPGALLLAALTAGGLVVGGWLVRRAGRRDAGSPARDRRRRPWRGRLTVLACVVTAACTAASAGVAVVRVRSTPWPPPSWTVVACDVGQGDALVVRSGPRSAVVVDTGPEPGPVNDCLRALDVAVVDLLVLSHFHADHVGGIAGVLDGRRVTRVLTSPLAVPARQAERVSAALQEADVPAGAAWAGVSGTAGDVRWRVVWPSRLLEGDGDGANDASVGLVLDVAGLRLLAAGDVEPPAQVALRRELTDGGTPDVAPVDVLKAAHHGSAAQDPGLHRLLAPRVALVSAGTGNDYGHPTPAALELLASTGATVMRTDVHGSVAVGGAAQDLWVAAQRPSPGRGRLTSWRRDEGRPPAAAARHPSRPGGTWSLRRSCWSPGPRGSSPTGRSSDCAAVRARRAPTSRSWPWTRRSTRAASSPRGRAPPCSVSPGSCWSRASSRRARPSSPTPPATWTTSSPTSSWRCGTPAASGAARCSRRSVPVPRPSWSTARR